MGSLCYVTNLVLGIMFFTSHCSETHGLLYPRESETREVRSLDGMWNFVKGNTNDPKEGFREEWFKYDLSKVRPTIPMPVPSSYNDLTEDAELRDHVGQVWYDRRFFAPQSWSKHTRVWIRFGSVHYMAIVVRMIYLYHGSDYSRQSLTKSLFSVDQWSRGDAARDWSFAFWSWHHWSTLLRAGEPSHGVMWQHPATRHNPSRVCCRGRDVSW